jgi:hypothetical protein
MTQDFLQDFVCIAWVLFLFTLLASGYCAAYHASYPDFAEKHPIVVISLSLLLYGLLRGAFGCLSVYVSGYNAGCADALLALIVLHYILFIGVTSGFKWITSPFQRIRDR